MIDVFWSPGFVSYLTVPRRCPDSTKKLYPPNPQKKKILTVLSLVHESNRLGWLIIHLPQEDAELLRQVLEVSDDSHDHAASQRQACLLNTQSVHNSRVIALHTGASPCATGNTVFTPKSSRFFFSSLDWRAKDHITEHLGPFELHWETERFWILRTLQPIEERNNSLNDKLATKQTEAF